MRNNYVTLDQKNYLLPFNLENAPMTTVSQSVLDTVKEICDVDTYLKAL